MQSFGLEICLPPELVRHCVLFSDNPNCLLVSRNFYCFWRERLCERGERRGLNLLRHGSFFGIVLTKESDKMLVVGQAAISGNKRLLKKVLYRNKKECFAYCQESALYGASFSGNKKLSLWIRKRFRATCVSGFNGALDGGHENLCKYWWKKLCSTLCKKNRRHFLSSAMIRCAGCNPKLFPLLQKMGGKPGVAVFVAATQTRNHSLFSSLLPDAQTKDFPLILLYAVKTRNPSFVFSCFEVGMIPGPEHFQAAREKKDEMKRIFAAKLSFP
ncbi:hypothetical protein GMAR_ORF95 [Golden Marseillevirus]|uniref:hypothetical protein n=1 Tax=Golden Marseillevirus TaxID=1720526 RepID=UPI000877AC89|nr:hypothetical protein GMAR_ORF95 [Golden Marseillevirus]ALX27469.1 hypothetical protein GMAR_ORF95 [Golden Marseillevirus]